MFIFTSLLGLSTWQQRVHPQACAEQPRIVRLDDLLVSLLCSFASVPTAPGANAEGKINKMAKEVKPIKFKWTKELKANS